VRNGGILSNMKKLFVCSILLFSLSFLLVGCGSKNVPYDYEYDR